MKKVLVKILRTLTVAAVAGVLAVSLPAGERTAGVNAAADYYLFDFGGGGTANGYTGVSAADAYSSAKGYGFAETGNMKNVSAAGSGALSDAVQFVTYGNKSTNTFNVDLDDGLYEISVWLGNTTRTSVAAEGVLQIINMTGNNAYHSFQLPVTDGQLNINCTAGKEGYAYTLSAMEIKRISPDAAARPTIWVCGDSTVCNYYPLDSSVQAGWAQLLGKYVDTEKYDIKNLAASGQYAKGFVNAGQFEPILKYGKEGDIYIISIGINDTNYSNADEYYATVKEMAQQAMEKGIEVILIKQQGRADDISRSTLLSGRWFGGQLDTIAAELNIQVIDLFNLFQNHCLTIGQAAVYGLYMNGDTLHPNRAGADKLAELVAAQIDFSDTVPEVYRTGDLDNDGFTSVIDCAVLERGLRDGFSSQTVRNAVDVDGSTTVNAADFRALKRFVLNSDAAIVTFTNIYYAVDAAVFNGVIETVNGGYTGAAYVNLNNEVGSAIEFTVKTAQAGNYLCSFNIANASTNDRNMMITVNNGTEAWLQSFLTTGAWTVWNERGIVLPLQQGMNTIKLVSNTAEGAPNIDYLRIALTEEPIAVPYDPNHGGDDMPAGEKPTVFIAGDSTAQSYRESYAPQQGWGYYLGNYVTSDVTVANHAIAGRSSKSFYDNGRLTTILNAMKSGDFLLICFGINDGASSNAERYAPVCGSVQNAAEGSFEYYIKFYIEGTLAKGATPILLSPPLSIKNQQQPFSAGYRNIDSAMKMLADYYDIPYFDLQAAMVNDFNTKPYNMVYNYYLGSATEGGTDFTHFTGTGADAAAGIIAKGIKDLNCALSAYIK